MFNAPLLLETALLMLAAFLAGAVLGTAARWLVRRARPAAMTPAVTAQPATPGPPLVVAPEIAPVGARATVADRIAAAAEGRSAAVPGLSAAVTMPRSTLPDMPLPMQPSRQPGETVAGRHIDNPEHPAAAPQPTLDPTPAPEPAAATLAPELPSAPSEPAPAAIALTPVLAAVPADHVVTPEAPAEDIAPAETPLPLAAHVEPSFAPETLTVTDGPEDTARLLQETHAAAPGTPVPDVTAEAPLVEPEVERSAAEADETLLERVDPEPEPLPEPAPDLASSEPEPVAPALPSVAPLPEPEPVTLAPEPVAPVIELEPAPVAAVTASSAMEAEPVPQPVVAAIAVETAPAPVEPAPAPIESAPAEPAPPAPKPAEPEEPRPELSEAEAELAAMRAIEAGWTPRPSAAPRPAADLPEGVSLEESKAAQQAVANSGAAVANAAARAAAILEAIGPAPVPANDTAAADAVAEPPAAVTPEALPVAVGASVAATPTESLDEPKTAARTPGGFGRPPALEAPREGSRDSLGQIKGISPAIESALNGLGIYHFDQIADWDQKAVVWVENHFGFKGRISRERWLDQARDLARRRPALARPVRR